MSVDQPGQPAPHDTPTQADPFAPGTGTPPVPSGGHLQQYAPFAGGPPGTVRGTGVSMLLFFVTFGIYGLVWYFQTHEEMKRHTGQGLGGLIALLIAIFIGIASPYLVSSEVGGLYERRGQTRPVSGVTGLWYFPGMLILVGPFVWFVKTNGALNAYWRSVGAP